MRAESRRPLAFRIVQATLRLYPKSFREEFGAAILEAFAMRFRRASQSGSVVEKLGVCAWFALDLARSVPREHLSLRMRRFRQGKVRKNMGRDHAGLLDSFVRDLSYAVRWFKRRPAFYSVVMLVFTLGIGANTIIFSVVDGVVLRQLPYPAPHRLVVPWQTDLSLVESPAPHVRAYGHRFSLSYPVYRDWLEQNTVFESLGIHTVAGGTFLASWDGQAERIGGARFTHGVFAALGVQPVLGRTFIREEDQVRGPSRVVLGYGLWQRRFGSDTGVIGRTMILDEQPHTIVGVMPQGFQFPAGSEIWTNFSNAGGHLLDRDHNSFEPIARLRPNVTLEQAQREMEILAEHLREIHPGPGTGYGVNIVYLHDETVRSVRPALLLLLGCVGIFLVIACANIANLLLVRTSERRNELAVRLSLGASRGRILGQLLTEGLALSVAGGVLGTLVAVVCADPFIAFLPSDTPRLGEIGADVRVLAFSAVLTVMTGMTVGALPALGPMRTRLTTVLQDKSRGSSGSRHRNRTQSWLLVSQIALTFVLLVAAGLLVKSFARLTSVERGFDAEGVVTLDIDMRASRYASERQQRAAFEELYERLRAIPGVTDVGATRAGPFLSRWSNDIRVQTSAGYVHTSPLMDFVSGSYFKTMGIPLLGGRTFHAGESFGAAPVVIVNETLARAFWPNAPAIGKSIIWEEAVVDTASPRLTVVGVVGNTRRRLAEDPFPAVYYPLFYGNPTIILKTEVSPTQVRDAVRAAVRAVDPAIPIVGIRILERTISASVAGPRVRTVLVGGLAALAATIAVVGVFGVLAYAVAQRTGEIGIRMALGAETTDVIRGVVCRGLTLLGAGAGIGLAVSLVSVRALQGFLFGVDPIDYATLLSVVAVLTVATLAASFFPARRAARVDPVEALRRE